MTLRVEDASNFIIEKAREGVEGPYSSYGYDIYLPNYMRLYAREVLKEHEPERMLKDLSPSFYAAAWELCRRGIIRPGVKTYRSQETSRGSAGNGYSITPFGSQWLQEEDDDSFIPTEPGRFAEMLEPFKQRFGPAFYERAQEAIRCYGAHAYLACCAMCGAASESILLATAIAKTNDPEGILKKYASKGGRGRVENMVVGQAKRHVEREFRAYTSLLKYWRDYAAHGQSADISDNEAYTSLAMLLRYTMTVDDYWEELTT